MIFDSTHPDYDFEYERWVYARDHYEARVIWPGEEYIDKYLIKRKQAETDDGFQERKDLADYTPFFAFIVESMSGRLFSVEDKKVMRWQNEDSTEGLGDKKEIGTPSNTVYHNADGKGTNWGVVWKQFANDISVYTKLWVLVDPKNDRRNQPAVKIINPIDVTDWHEEGDRIVQVKVKDTNFLRDSIYEIRREDDLYIIYDLNGWTKYRRFYVEDDKGDMVEKEEIVDKGSYYFEDRDGNQTLPIFQCTLPLRRNSGYILARKANAIFNKESAKDWLEWAANFPKLVHYANDELFNQTAQKISEGSNFIQGDTEARHATDYISPDTGPAEINRESLKQKIEHFLYVAFKEYNDSAKEKTATERRLDDAEGVGAYLELLKSTIDEAENHALWLIEQCYFPLYLTSIDDEGNVVINETFSSNRKIWGQAYVERSSDFIPVDRGAMVKELKEMIFGFDPVPSDTVTKLEAVKEIFDYYGLPYSEDDLTLAIESKEATATQGRDTDSVIDRVMNG